MRGHNGRRHWPKSTRLVVTSSRGLVTLPRMTLTWSKAGDLQGLSTLGHQPLNLGLHLQGPRPCCEGGKENPGLEQVGLHLAVLLLLHLTLLLAFQCSCT